MTEYIVGDRVRHIKRHSDVVYVVQEVKEATVIAKSEYSGRVYSLIKANISLESRSVICPSCKSSYNSLTTYKIYPDKTVTICRNCFANFYFRCRLCKETKHIDEQEPRSKGYCCTSCASKLKQCNLCDCFVSKLNEWGHCTHCAESQIAEAIRPYGFKPRKHLWLYTKEDKTSISFPYLGLELEVSRKDDANVRNSEEAYRLLMSLSKSFKGSNISGWSSPFYVKFDRSIKHGTGDGFEIVSHPMTWRWIKENRNNFDPIFDLVERGYESLYGHQCGMHVHLSLEAFEQAHLPRFVMLFYRNENLWTRISEKDKESMRIYSPFDDPIDEVESSALNRQNLLKKNVPRRTAVNITRSTVEIRIFKGALQRERFLKNIEASHAAYSFTKDNVYDYSTSNADAFLDWIAENREEYPNLYSFLVTKRILKNTYKVKLIPTPECA